MFTLIGLFCIELFVENASGKQSDLFRMDYLFSDLYSTFYRIHDTATTWNKARQICEAEGTALLVPDNINENEHLKILLSNMQPHFTAVFVGLHDQFSKGDFVNLQGKPIADTFLDLLWGEGLPDDENGAERCVVMTRFGLLDDKPCDDLYPFMCKIHVNDTKQNFACNGYDAGYRTRDNFKKCYKFHVEPLTWHEAYLVCTLEYGQLVVINDAEEANHITSILGDNLKSNAPDTSFLFVGFSDLMFPYQYRTIKGETLEEAGYASWSPVVEDFETMQAKRCGAISSTGFLQITYCDYPGMFICEKAKNFSYVGP